MIEYLHDVIRVSAGYDAQITASITGEDGKPITAGCLFHLHDSNDEHLLTVEGECIENTWIFTLPAAATKDYKGRYWYCICDDSNAFCFKRPIYFV